MRRQVGGDVEVGVGGDALAAAMRGIGLEPKASDSWPQLADELLSKTVEPELIAPTISSTPTGGSVGSSKSARR